MDLRVPDARVPMFPLGLHMRVLCSHACALPAGGAVPEQGVPERRQPGAQPAGQRQLQVSLTSIAALAQPG